MLLDHLERQLAARRADALLRRRRTAQGACGPHQQVADGTSPPRDMLAFCSNDYLGLAQHQHVRAGLIEGAQRDGVGSGASHLVSGHHAVHVALEQRLAEMLAPHVPDARALFFCSGYMANLAVLTALGDAQATIFSEALNHASLIDGARLAKAAVEKYAHADVAGLEAQLAACRSPVKLIVTDAVFSMDGDIAPLPELLALAERHDAWVVVDDAHGFGVLGEQGRGSLAHFGLCSERLIYMGTLGKAAGVAGAFVAAHPTVIDWLVQSARTYIYTTAAPLPLAHALLASLDLIRGDEGEQRRQHLRALVTRLRDGLGEVLAGHRWCLAPSDTAIQPLIVGANADALQLAAALETQGCWVPAIRPPTVPAGTARLRITLSAAHREADVDRLVQALARAAGEVAR
ncbi:8-amino-7-oxononanoate synthase [Caldimonas brevitalea]|uniref:8-amino-7-oxononanoate synthase n=1 Tax=Caldimonas brevitalea TaxID=413882 RepID=A0A0G3BTJ8_9BURK|nr:8-amino-7-oxononanoate synthase [Caldimonas brevitalea]AKJ31318.1 8-amino-7-oxononanoate synthase [Caldimonas brevitalea]